MIVTISGFKKFVRSQSDRKKIDMDQIEGSNRTGCILVQFGRRCLKFDENFECGLFEWIREDGDDDITLAELEGNHTLYTLFDTPYAIKNYADAKRLLK